LRNPAKISNVSGITAQCKELLQLSCSSTVLNKLLTHLHWVGNDLLCLKCVDYPHGNIADEQKSHHLAPWLAAVMLWQVDTATAHISNEKQLQYHLCRPISVFVMDCKIFNISVNKPTWLLSFWINYLKPL
jgi:hypothetical protein